MISGPRLCGRSSRLLVACLAAAALGGCSGGAGGAGGAGGSAGTSTGGSTGAGGASRGGSGGASVYTAQAPGSEQVVVLKLLGMVMQLRAATHLEGLGMDVTQHGEEAYSNGEGSILVLPDADAAPTTVPTLVAQGAVR